MFLFSMTVYSQVEYVRCARFVSSFTRRSNVLDLQGLYEHLHAGQVHLTCKVCMIVYLQAEGTQPAWFV